MVRKLLLNPDRSGHQQLYLMGADGSGVHRISFGDGRYATPVWSPRGDLIAFTKMKGGEFLHRCHAPGWFWRAIARQWFPGGRADMGT